MEKLRIFLDHLVFSLIAVFLTLLVLSIFGSGIFGAIAYWFGEPSSMEEFSIGNNLLISAAVWLGVSLILAGILTIRSVRNLPKDNIVYTKRSE